MYAWHDETRTISDCLEQMRINSLHSGVFLMRQGDIQWALNALKSTSKLHAQRNKTCTSDLVFWSGPQRRNGSSKVGRFSWWNRTQESNLGQSTAGSTLENVHSSCGWHLHGTNLGQTRRYETVRCSVPVLRTRSSCTWRVFSPSQHL